MAHEPALEFPEPPRVRFQCMGGYCCLTEPDANLLNRWAQKLQEFRAARERLLKD